MIKNTIDIINRAKELADLQNSDFISLRENVSLLNEAYTKLYTELINHKDRFFVKIITVKDLELINSGDHEAVYKLPSDFYMLCNISKGVDCQQIMKKAPAESKSNQRYDIINNCLYLYGGVEQTELNIEYWPSPEHLTLKPNAKEIALDETISVYMQDYLACNDNYILGVKNTTDESYNKLSFYLYSIAKRTGITVDEITGYVNNVTFIGKNNEILCSVIDQTTENFPFLIYSGRYTNNGVIDNTKKNIIGRKDGILYFMEQQEDNTLNLYSFIVGRKTLIKSGITLPEGYIIPATYSDTTNNYIVSFTFNDDDIFYSCVKYQGEDTFSVIVNSEGVEIDSSFGRIKKPEVFNNDLYFNTLDGVVKNNEFIVTFDDFESLENVGYAGVNKVDLLTGYGISVVYDNTLYIYPAVKNTEIDFPNNFYFQYLSYMLAIAYKSKQNADATMLENQANNESRQFYNSINQDANQNFRINNVYNNGGWL